MIDPDCVQLYREQGWVVVPNVLTPDQVAEGRRAMTGMLEGARGLRAHDDRYDLEPDHRPDAPRVRRLKSPHQWNAFFADLLRSHRLLSIYQAVLGSAGVRLLGSKLNLKGPSGGSAVEWHQDWAFDPHTNDSQLAAGIMLDDSTAENGAMLVLPGSHRGPVYDHHADGVFCGAIDVRASRLDVTMAVPCVGKAGSASFHHVRMVHGSAENTSSRPRALLLYEVAAVDAWPLAGVADLEEFNSRILTGSPTIAPPMADVPVRMPLPRAARQGSIYENQMAVKNRYFSQART